MRDSFGISNFNASRLKLPAFDEQKDNMNVYLERYEQFVTSQEWDEANWAVSLNPLLKGNGLQVYSSMPPCDAKNYEKLSGMSLMMMDFVGNLEKTNRKLVKQCFGL